MKWVTREKVKVDRVACPWLIRKFIDQEAEFIFVPSDQVAEVVEKEKAIPFDVSGAELGHHGGRCSFEAFIRKYDLIDPALRLLAQIVHGADVQNDLYGRPEAPGLLAIAKGFSVLGLKDDHETLARESIVYDALYAYCRNAVSTVTPAELRLLIGNKDTVLLDVRRDTDFAADPAGIPGAERRLPEKVDEWAEQLPKDKEVLLYCVRGGSVSNRVLDELHRHGLTARYLQGGLEAWKKSTR